MKRARDAATPPVSCASKGRTIHTADLTLTEQSSLLKRGDCSSRELVETCLRRIGDLDDRLHAFAEVYANEARKLAHAADTARAAGLPLHPFHGLPIGFKDLFDIAGRRGTMGSAMWEARKGAITAAVVERSLAAGMIPIGKMHMVEFAFGAWGTNPRMGTPWNPWDASAHRVPGGSSSGTAVAVAAGMVPAGIGSDTGGSVRVPACFNGLTGLKPTAGRISLHGAGMLSWTLDSIGPLARSVDDCAGLLRLLAGPDWRDPATLAQPALDLPEALPARELRCVRIALPHREQLPPFVAPPVLDAWSSAARQLEKLGADVVPAAVPEWFFDLAAPVSTIIASEAFALHRGWIEDARQPIGQAVRGRITAAHGFAPGEYAEALRTMEERRHAFREWFGPFDALLLPTVGVPAPLVDHVDESSPVPSYLTRPGNYLGLCALALPAGLHEGLPVGIQLLGKPYCERRVLEIGKAFQAATAFHAQRPDTRALPA